MKHGSHLDTAPSNLDTAPSNLDTAPSNFSLASLLALVDFV